MDTLLFSRRYITTRYSVNKSKKKKNVIIKISPEFHIG